MRNYTEFLSLYEEILTPNHPPGGSGRGGVMRSWAVKTAIFFLTTAVLAGCGGGSSSSTNVNNTVAQVTLTPAVVSLVAGQITTLTAGTLNAGGGPITPPPTITFNSSNPNLVTVDGAGDICGGVWDSTFVVCNGKDSSGKPLVGTATITASSEGVTSPPVQVSVHPAVTSIQVTQTSGNIFPNCVSHLQTAQFKAQAFNNGVDITNEVGAFSWVQSSESGAVATIDANGLATSENPGLAGIVATLGNVSSPAVNFKSCLPVKIVLHLNGDPAGMPTESATLNVNGTETIQADMVDENNNTFASVTGQGVSIISNNPVVASVADVTLTGVSPGGAGLLAVCAPQTCGSGLTTPIYSNLFSVTVNGTSPATMVFATSSFQSTAAPSPTPTPSATPSPTPGPSIILPIDTSKTPPTAGTPINMPCLAAGCAVPNSMLMAANGATAFMGTSQGLAALSTAANTVTLLDPFVGKVLAVSPDGNTAIESNAPDDPATGKPIESDGASQRVVFVSGTTAQSFVLSGAVAAAFTGDGSKAFVVANCSQNTTPTCANGNQNVYVFAGFSGFASALSPLSLNLGGATANNIDATPLTSGPFVYVANVPGSLQALGSCNNTVQATAPPTHSSNLQLLQSFKNADAFAAVDGSGVDLETATVTALTPPVNISPANCAPNITYNDNFVNFGMGPLTANQLLLGSNMGSHTVVLPSGLAELLVVNASSTPSSISLASGATEALSGGLTLDGNTAWVGVAGTNNVDEINLTSGSDVLQIPTHFVKSDGSAAPPNLVVVQPK